MTYVFLRFLFGVWFIFFLGGVGVSFATLVWGTYDGTRRVPRALKRLLYSVIWPLALLTINGRKQLKELF